MRFILIAALVAASLLGSTAPAPASSVLFPNGMLLVKDHNNFTVGSCPSGALCTFTGPVMLGIAQQFNNVDYSCAANQAGGSGYVYGLNFECYPQTIMTFELVFLNTTGSDLSGTVMTISYSALGAASGSAHLRRHGAGPPL